MYDLCFFYSTQSNTIAFRPGTAYNWFNFPSTLGQNFVSSRNLDIYPCLISQLLVLNLNFFQKIRETTWRCKIGKRLQKRFYQTIDRSHIFCVAHHSHSLPKKGVRSHFRSQFLKRVHSHSPLLKKSWFWSFFKRMQEFYIQIVYKIQIIVLLWN